MTFIHQSLSDRIYEYLKEGIVTNGFKPGDRLEEQDLADSLSVSRTPVREALGRLGADGLVTILPRRGALVVSLSAKDIKDIYDVRESLEVLAIELCVERMTGDDMANLERIHQEFADALDRGEFRVCFARDREFHDELMKLSSNSKLKEFYDRLAAPIQVTRLMHCENRASQESSYRQHSAILAALKERDAARAGAHMREHLRKVKADLLANQPQPA
jgi:DNA-binding GntR family transcriptional regulator